LKTIRVRDEFYNRVKDIAEKRKITLGEAVEMIANHNLCDYSDYNRGHIDLKPNHDNHDNHDIHNHDNHDGSDFVTRGEFNQVIEDLWCKVCNWTEELLRNLKEKAGIDLEEN